MVLPLRLDLVVHLGDGDTVVRDLCIQEGHLTGMKVVAVSVVCKTRDMVT